MFRISRLGRLAAAAVLVASGATVALTAPAGAANTPINYDCVSQYTYLDVNNSDTLTITITITITANTGCGYIVFSSPQGALGAASLNAVPLTLGMPTATSVGDVVVYTAPASGSGQDDFAFLPNPFAPPGPQITVSFPSPAPCSDTLVDNGDGSMTVTFDPVGGMQEVYVNIYPSGTTCSSNGSPLGRLYVLSTSPMLPEQMSSPTTIAAGSTAFIAAFGPPTETTIAAGSYEVCLYFNSGTAPTELVQSLAVTLAEVAPTTSTTTTGGSSTTTSPAGDPVVPAFAG